MFFKSLFKKIKKEQPHFKPYEMPNYFCSNCNADFEKQPGYEAGMLYWTCKSCGKLMINPEITDDDVMWFCDRCETCLNEQPGFEAHGLIWKCLKCGNENKINPNEIYASEALYEADKNNPTRGMCDADVIKMLEYQEICPMGTDSKVTIVRHPDTGEKYIKKILDTYDANVVRELQKDPIPGMPQIIEVFEGTNHLIIIEEYIKGNTLEEFLCTSLFNEGEVLHIMLKLCETISCLHKKTPSIIHRDIKPSNIILSEKGLIYLLDIDAAKNYKADELEDTVLLGTKAYAAPEQYGFGASTIRTDIYAMGILMNVLLTGKFPKQQLTDSVFAGVIEKCTRLDPNDRFETVEDLKIAIMELMKI